MQAPFLNLWILMVCSLHAYTTNAAVELQSYNYPDHYIKRANLATGGAVTIHRQARPDLWYIVRPGLCGNAGSASIRTSVHNSNIYIRYRNGLVYAEANDGTTAFSNSACFYIRENKWFPGHAAFESVTTPGHYLRHQFFQLKLHPYSSTALFEMDASFRILQATCRRFRSYNYPNHYIGLNGNDAYIVPHNTTPLDGSSTWPVWSPRISIVPLMP